jgi:endonuclease G
MNPRLLLQRALVVAIAAMAVWSLGCLEASAGQFDGCAGLPPLGAPTLVRAAHTVPVCHSGYAALDDTDLKVPRWVAYQLTAEHTFGCLPRTNDFHVDEALTAAESATTADYLHSGFDQGHQAPAEDLAWDSGEEHDTFSMANMAPQLPGLNRQGWERLEETVRAWAWARGKVQVYVGPIINPGEPTIGPDAVTVPNGFWKVVVDQARGEAIAFIMPQKPIAKGDLTPFETSIGTVEVAAGMRLPLPAAVDRGSVPPLWSADLKAWRKMHKQACAGRSG